MDTVHTDLIDPSDGTKLVSDEELMAGTSTSTTTMFVNGGSVTATGVAAAINKCNRLECVVLLECVVSPAVLTALSRGTLRGFVAHMCDFDDVCPEDLVKFIQSNPSLQWLGINIQQAGPEFNMAPEVWAALPDSLRVFVFEGPDGRAESMLAENAACIKEAVARMRHLEHLMVEADCEGKSRVQTDGTINQEYSNRSQHDFMEDFLEDMEAQMMMRGHYHSDSDY